MIHKVEVPELFSWAECLQFLGRSDKEILHRVENGRLRKLWSGGNRTALLEIGQEDGNLWVKDLLSDEALPKVALDYVREMFDLDRDLQPFYASVRQDATVFPLLDRYAGLRLVRIPGLFETLAWTIIGQQINLGFAYSMKARMVEAVGQSVEFQGERHYLFPEPAEVLQLRESDLKAMQYSRQKADYLLALAETMASGKLEKGDLLALEAPLRQHKRLVELRGIGPWSADYTLLKCLGVPSAMPLTDAGLHNALRAVHGLAAKPSLDQIRAWAKNWAGWEGYVTFFLWRSLIDQ